MHNHACMYHIPDVFLTGALASFLLLSRPFTALGLEDSVFLLGACWKSNREREREREKARERNESAFS